MEIKEIMKESSYYVVNVSFREGNPAHKSIAYHSYDGHIKLFDSYESIIEVNKDSLNALELIEEIRSMN